MTTSTTAGSTDHDLEQSPPPPRDGETYDDTIVPTAASAAAVTENQTVASHVALRNGSRTCSFWRHGLFRLLHLVFGTILIGLGVRNWNDCGNHSLPKSLPLWSILYGSFIVTAFVFFPLCQSLWQHQNKQEDRQRHLEQHHGTSRSNNNDSRQELPLYSFCFWCSLCQKILVRLVFLVLIVYGVVGAFPAALLTNNEDAFKDFDEHDSHHHDGAPAEQHCSNGFLSFIVYAITSSVVYAWIVIL
ncbi:hypothetical protein ACA910_022470 [Epithemia clementina (nom. ined.)]